MSEALDAMLSPSAKTSFKKPPICSNQSSRQESSHAIRPPSASPARSQSHEVNISVGNSVKTSLKGSTGPSRRLSSEIQQVVDKVVSGDSLRGSSNTTGVLDGYQVMSADEFMLSGPEAADGHQFEAVGGPALSGGLGRKASKTGRYAIIVAVPNEDSEDNVSTDFTSID